MSEVEQILKTELNEDQRDLLAAMLAAVARADGRIDSSEVAFLKSFLGDRIQETDDGGIEAPALPLDDEMGRRATGVAEPLYLACSLLMCADEEADEAEKALLVRFGKVMNVDSGRKTDLDTLARVAILDQAAYAMSSYDHIGADKIEALKDIASRVGASEKEVDDLCQRYDLI